MGLEVNFQVIEAPTSDAIWIFDTTGFFHAVNNPTGWGGTNPMTNNVTTCTVEVTLPDPTTLEVSTDPALTFTLAGTPLPNVIGNKLAILNTSLGLLADQTLIDGNYQIVITVAGTFDSEPFTQTFTTVQTLFGLLRCCAATKTVNADIADCGCAPCREKLFKTMLVNLGVSGIISSNSCGKPNKGLEILKTATGLCENSDCQGCN